MCIFNIPKSFSSCTTLVNIKLNQTGNNLFGNILINIA